MDQYKLKRLAGIPVDLSKVEHAKATIRTPAKLLGEAAKVPQHRGELAPKTKDNMKARVKHIAAALEALECAREALMEIPAVDYQEDIPTIIKQLHHMLHGEDGTGGVHHLHRQYKHEFDSTVFPEDIEEEKEKAEQEAVEAEAGVTDEDKKTNESVGFEKQDKGPAVDKKNVRAFKLADGSEKKTMYTDGEKDIAKDPRERTPKPKVVQETTLTPPQEAKAVNAVLSGDDDEDEEVDPRLVHAKKELEGSDLARKELAKNPFEQEEHSDELLAQHEHAQKMLAQAKTDEEREYWRMQVLTIEDALAGERSEECEMTVGVRESQGPLFARDAKHPKVKDNAVSVQYPSWADGKRPVNVVSSEDGVSPYYPDGSKSENPSQIPTNPYNESQAVRVPSKITSALKAEADTARKLAETFTLRKDWDNKNFHENLANAFDTLNGFLEKGTIYGIKEAQVFMTSLMSPMMNKIPADVIKFIAAGGAQRSLKSYLNDVKEPHTGTVYHQDSSGLN